MNICVWFGIPFFSRNITLHQLLTSSTVKVLMERKEYIIAPSGALLFPNLKNLKKKKKKHPRKIPYISGNWTFVVKY